MARPPLSWLRALHARPRLVVALALGAAVYLALHHVGWQSRGTQLLVAWNAGALLHLALIARMARRATPAVMQRRALQQDEGRFVILAMVTVAVAAVLLAVGSQLAEVKQLQGWRLHLHIALAGATVVTAWLFLQLLFALHYAHDFYAARSRQEPDPLQFPGTADPLYPDFIYFAFVIGASAQTADVSFNGSALRGVGTWHCVLTLFFNVALLGLGINIVAGLL
jgi:uncharacterized membrane protein